MSSHMYTHTDNLTYRHKKKVELQNCHRWQKYQCTEGLECSSRFSQTLGSSFCITKSHTGEMLWAGGHCSSTLVFHTIGSPHNTHRAAPLNWRCSYEHTLQVCPSYIDIWAQVRLPAACICRTHPGACWHMCDLETACWQRALKYFRLVTVLFLTPMSSYPEMSKTLIECQLV